MPNLMTRGNTKLGPSIGVFSLPRVGTCPGASELCISHCYAKRFNRFPQLEARYRKQYEATKRDTFVARIIEEIRDNDFTKVRIHVVGDFYSAEYTRKWESIAKQLPAVVFFAYTRSWRDRKMLRFLERFRRLPNVQLWWSADRETGQPPEGQVAYMAVDDDDEPQFSADLVFRVKRSTVRLTVANVPVCPKERGTPSSDKVTCSRCRLCYSRALAAVTQTEKPTPLTVTR